MKPVLKDDAEKPAWAEAIEREAAERGVSLDDVQKAVNVATEAAIEREAAKRGQSRDELLADIDQEVEHQRWLKERMAYRGVTVKGWAGAVLLAEKGKNYGKSQSKAASAPRKLTIEQQKSIAKEYWRRVKDGEQYGAVKDLSARFDVSTETIRTTAKKYKQN
jgi:hypothetical protein